MRTTLGFLLVLVLAASPLWAQTPPYRINTGTLTATGSVAVNTSGMGTAGVQLSNTGSPSGTVTFEVTLDNTTWKPIDCATEDDPSTAVNTATAEGLWTCPVASTQQFRARISTYTSGTFVLTVSASATGVVGALGGVDINNPSATTARNNVIMEGCVAPDADVSACQPVQVGGSASNAVPTAMSADGDAVRWWCNRNGACHVLSTWSTPATTSVNDSATNVTLVAANTSRTSLRCTNTSTAVLYLKFGATATTSSYTVALNAGQYYNLESPVYTGIVDGIWATDPNAGAALCTEGTQ